MGRILSRDDLDELSETATEADDPATVAAELVNLASGGRLADPADAGYAYLLAAEIHERSDDLATALALAEQALDAYRRVGHPDLANPRDYRARLLLQLGREDEAMAELAQLRPSAQSRNGHAEPAGDRLISDDQPAGGFADDDHPAGDEFAGDNGFYSDADGTVLLIWPGDAYEQVDQRWPELLEPTGAEDWDEYRGYCQALIAGWASRRRGPLYQVTGDPDEFEEWMAEQGADPYHSNLVTLAREYGDYLAEQGDPVELPPAPEEPCWCGSGGTYAGCCRTIS